MIRPANDLIAAIATAQGEGGIAIVRVSGPGAKTLLSKAFSPKKPGPMRSHQMRYGFAVDGEGKPIDECMAVFMKAPNTYTRQDLFEIHCHGGRAAARAVLSRVLSLGARVADSGEFTLRAFLNGRMDLSEAEAVMGLIRADSEAARRMSLSQLTGGVSRFVLEARDALTRMLSAIEAAGDFPDEVDEAVTAGEVLEEAKRLSTAIAGRCNEQGARMVREGVRVAICGRPNVGKSSLLNALLGSSRAIVTDIPGTTRDVLTERMTISGLPVLLSDTAGQRETGDAVERIGVTRAREEMQNADVVLLLLDGSAALQDEDRALLSQADERTVILRTKADLPGADWSAEGAISLSAKTGEGMDRLLEALRERVSRGELSEGQLVEERHIRCAMSAREAMERAVKAIGDGMPLDAAAVDLWEARRLLGEITGDDATEAVITDIFSRFCVGK